MGTLIISLETILNHSPFKIPRRSRQLTLLVARWITQSYAPIVIIVSQWACSSNYAIPSDANLRWTHFSAQSFESDIEALVLPEKVKIIVWWTLKQAGNLRVFFCRAAVLVFKAPTEETQRLWHSHAFAKQLRTKLTRISLFFKQNNWLERNKKNLEILYQSKLKQVGYSTDFRPLIGWSLQWEMGTRILNRNWFFTLKILFRYLFTIDDYAKEGRPEAVWHLCSFYRDPLRS